MGWKLDFLHEITVSLLKIFETEIILISSKTIRALVKVMINLSEFIDFQIISYQMSVYKILSTTYLIFISKKTLNNELITFTYY